jgi:hypothetical protein
MKYFVPVELYVAVDHLMTVFYGLSSKTAFEKHLTLAIESYDYLVLRHLLTI